MAITIHEFCHALAAWSLGDDTAREAGRLTLNPIRHLDPFGSLMLLLTALAGVGFGWGKPVPVNVRALRYGRLGMAIVSAAGPVSNLAMALLTALFVRALSVSDQVVPAWGAQFLARLIALNVGLCVFNLLPIAPLDGFGVAVGVLPWSIAAPIARLGRYGPGILMMLVFSRNLIHIDLLGKIIMPPWSAIMRVLERVAGAA